MEIEIMKGYIKCNAGDEVQRVKDQLSLMSYILNQRIHLACYLLMKSVEGYEPDFKIDFVIDAIKTAYEREYYIELYYIFLPTAEECINRVTSRLKYGGRPVSDKDIIRSFNQTSDRLNTILPYCDECSYFDNFNGFIEVDYIK